METTSIRRKKQFSLEIKREAIEDLENGFETEESLCQKYSVITQTVRNWQRQIKYEVSGNKSRLKILESERRKAVREVESGLITIAEAAVKYGARSKNTIRAWLKRFSSDISNDILLNMPKSQEDQADPSAIQQRQRELESALSQAHLKVASLETLIDVAEKELHIDIRKKSGTKQS